MDTKKKPVNKKRTPIKSKGKKSEIKCYIEFNTYNLLFQMLSLIIAIAAVTLNAVGSINVATLVDLFIIALIFAVFSLFPKKRR